MSGTTQSEDGETIVAVTIAGVGELRLEGFDCIVKLVDSETRLLSWDAQGIPLHLQLTVEKRRVNEWDTKNTQVSVLILAPGPGVEVPDAHVVTIFAPENLFVDAQELTQILNLRSDAPMAISWQHAPRFSTVLNLLPRPEVEQEEHQE